MAGEQRRTRMAIGGNGACIGNQHGFKQPLAFVCYQLVLLEIIVKDFPILISLMFGFQKLRNYLLEYHLSFYHVTSSTATNMDSGYGDERAVRSVQFEICRHSQLVQKRKAVTSTRNSCPSLPSAMVRMFTRIFSLLRNALAIRGTTPMICPST